MDTNKHISVSEKIIDLHALARKKLTTATALTVFCLLISACAPAAPTKSKDVTETAPATTTVTPTPTATIAPKLDYITEANSVQVQDKIIFVKDGKVLSYDQKTGEIGDANLSEIVFNTTADASRIVYELHKDEFDNQEQLHADLFPGGYPSDYPYKMVVEKSGSTSKDDGSVNIDVASIPVAFIKVKSPIDSSKYPTIGVVLSKVYGLSEPATSVLGVFDASGDFYPLMDSVLRFTTKSYTTTSSQGSEYVHVDQMSWSEIQKLLAGNIMVFSTLYSVPPGNGINYNYELYGQEKLSPDTIEYLQQLARFVAERQASAGFTYFQETDSTFQTGNMLGALDSEYTKENGMLLPILYTQFKILTP